MILTDYRTSVRSLTNRDADTLVTDDQLDDFIVRRYRALRAQIALIAPTLYATTDDEQVLTASEEDLDKPTDFSTLVRIEKKDGDNWYPVGVTDGLSPWNGCLNFREEGDVFKLAPARYVAGTYRIVYVPTPGDVDEEDDEELHVPEGCEEVIIQQACADVRVRLDDDPRPHLQEAARVWTEQKRAMRRRYGNHPVPGLRRVRWP